VPLPDILGGTTHRRSGADVGPGGNHPGTSEGLDQHVHDGNKLRVVERIPVVMCKPVFKLHFAETQQGCFRVCGLLAVIPARA
jgi:hypothetical protein